MALRVRGRSGAWPGFTTEYGPEEGFLVCEPRFEADEEVVVDVLVGFDRETGIQLCGRVRHVARGAATQDERWGVRVAWDEARSRDSSLGLARFLEQIVGLTEARVRQDGEPPYVFVVRLGAPPRPARAAPEKPAHEASARPEDRKEDSGAREILLARLGRPVNGDPQTGQRARTPPASQEVVTVDGDRRERPRIHVDTPVTWLTASTPHVGRARSISRSGLYVETDDPLPREGERVIVRFPVPHAGKHHLVVLTTEVVRHKTEGEKPQTAPGFAAKYVMIDELGRPGVLQHFLKSHGVEG